MSNLILKGRTYDFFKNLAQIYLPAVGTAYFSLAGIWDLPAAGKVVGTVVVVDTLLGGFLKLSQVSYDNSEERFDGTAFVDRSDPSNNPPVMLKAQAISKPPGELRLKVQETAPPIGIVNQDEPDDPLPGT